MTENASGSKPSAAEESKAVLADLLAQCRAAVTQCLHRADVHDDLDYTAAAARLVKSSIDLVAALEPSRREFVYRFIDDRLAPPAITSQVGPPSPPPAISQTISSDPEPETHNIG